MVSFFSSDNHLLDPFFRLKCRLSNIGDTVLILPLQDSIILSYYLNEKLIERRQISWDFPEKLSMIIAPYDTIEFSFGDNIFFGSGSVLQKSDFDYSQCLIKILPSLKVEYRSKYIPPLECDRIMNVKIIDNKEAIEN